MQKAPRPEKDVRQISGQLSCLSLSSPQSEFGGAPKSLHLVPDDLRHPGCRRRVAAELRVGFPAQIRDIARRLRAYDDLAKRLDLVRKYLPRVLMRQRDSAC
jgi:hypothetical protein